jgi:hypothetical protein
VNGSPVPCFPAAIRGFTFEKGAEKKICNATTWEIRFSETSHPTLIQDLKGASGSNGLLGLELE